MTDPAFKEPPRAMSESAFLARFGGVYEHSPWVAQALVDAGIDDGHDTVAGLSAAFADIVDRAGRDLRLALIRAHPDLAGKAAQRGDLTDDSASEQASAGIDRCTTEEFARFQHYNDTYRRKFGFPFVMAVKGSNRHQILAAFEERLGNDPDTEFDRAIGEIHRIARFRLEALAGD